jgi:hypothetical protein
MKKAVYTSVVLLVLAVGILGCGKSKPKEVALNWLTSVNHMQKNTLQTTLSACYLRSQSLPATLPILLRKS